MDILKWATELDASGFASGAQRVNSSLADMGIKTTTAQMNLGSLGTVLAGLANPLTLVTAGVMAVGTALAASVHEAAAWQTSMSGVSKTTGMTGQDLNNLSKELLDMSTRMPAAASEIANVAQVAGSLGIGQEVIAEFTEVAIQMGVGFEMSAEQAATAGAKILTAFKLDTTAENMEKLGSVVNAMGDSFAATEPQVLGFLNRASFLNTTMGQTIPQIAALGTVLISTGLEADVAATGLKSFLNMATSVRSKTGGMDNWAALMNISVEELKANLAGDFNQTLIDTANAIAAIEDPVERFQKAVALAGTEGAPAILKLAGQQENLQKALGLTNEEWEKAQSLQKTYAAQSETMNAQLQIFWNTLNMAGVELGSVLLPYITQGIGFLTDFAKIAIKAGESIWEMAQLAEEKLEPLLEIIRKIYSMSPNGLQFQAAGAGWDALKTWAGIGTAQAEEMATEIAENDKLKAAVDLSNPENMEAARKAGIKLGEETGDGMMNGISNVVSDPVYWKDLIPATTVDALTGRIYGGQLGAKWKDSIGQVFGSTVYESVGIAAVKEATVGSTYMVLKTENGKELARRDIYAGEFADDPVGAIYDMIRETTDLSGLSDIQSAELAGDMERADLLKIQAAKIETEIEAVNIWDNFNSEASLLKFETDNKEAFDKVSDIVVTHLYRAARDIEQNGTVVADLLGSSMGLAAGQVDPATLDESLQNVLNALADPGSVDTAILETSLAHLMGASLISASDSEEIKDAAEVAAKGYKSALFGALAESTENRSIAEMRAAGWTGIEDFAAWSKNEYQPTLKSEISEMNELWDKGYGANRDTAREYLELMMKDHEEHSEWFEDWQNHYIDLLQSGVLNEDQFFDAWENMAGKADEKAAAALEDIKSTNAMFYGEFLSDNARWQSYVNEYGGYVGPTKLYGGYRDAMDAEIADAQAVIQKYGISTVGSIGMVAELDTTEALSATEALVADINAMAPDMVLTLDINSARMAWLNFFADIETTNPTMHVTVDIDANAQDIAAKVEAAIVEALA